MSGMSTYLRNALHDFLHREQAFDPPATVYVALCSTAPTATTPGTEIDSGTHPSYAREALTHSLANISGTQGAGTTTASSGTSSEVSNNNVIDFGVAATAWGTVSHWETYDAPTGGNRLEYGTLVNGSGTPTARSIAASDPVSFPAAAFRYRMS